MGIRGLTTFIKKEKLLRDGKLQNMTVVIDGPNLSHFLYDQSEMIIRDRYGGDYDRYAYVINYFFELLEKCNVTAYVLYDGGVPEVKHGTYLERAQDRIETVDSMRYRRRDMHVFPLLAHDVFLHVIRERGVHVAVTDFEVDVEVAVLAQALGDAAVISNDSDFYVFNLPGGFIPYDYIQWDLHTPDTQSQAGDETPFLNVKWYYVSHLSEYISVPLLPILAAVTGNDYIDASVAQDLYKKIPQHYKVPQSDGRWKDRVQVIMEWLSDGPQEPQEALDRVLKELLPFDKRRQHAESIRAVFEYYLRPSGTLLPYFGISSPSSPTRKSSSSEDEGVEQKLGKRRLQQLRRGELPAKTIDVMLYKDKEVILKCQVEDLSKPSSFDCAVSLRQFVYGCLLSDASVKEYTRPLKIRGTDGNLKYFSKKVTARKLPTLDNPVEQLKTACSSNPLPAGSPWLKPGARLLHLSLVHWITETKPPTQLTQAVLVCLIKLSVIDPLNRFLKNNTTTDVCEGLIQVTGDLESSADATLKEELRCFRERINLTDDCVKLYSPVFGDVTVSKADVLHATDRLKDFCGTPLHSVEQQFNIDIVHRLAQWQACLKAVCWLSAVLDTSLPAPNPARILNASFVYCLARDLDKRPKSLLYLNESLGKGLSLLFTQLWEGLDITDAQRPDAQTSEDRTVVGNRFSLLRDGDL